MGGTGFENEGSTQADRDHINSLKNYYLLERAENERLRAEIAKLERQAKSWWSRIFGN